MALPKVNYVDHQTVITAANLNNIQSEIISTTGYTTCATAANTAAKTATMTDFVLSTGASVKVKFTYTNTAANPTLNINSTGAKAIVKYGSTAVGTTPTESWDAGSVVGFVYDGTSWIMQTRTDVDAVPKSIGGTFDGDINIVKANSGTGEVISTLRLGNNIDWGEVGNTYGAIELYSGHTQKVTFFAGNPSEDRELTCPDATGTIALTNNPTNMTINLRNGTTTSVGDSILILGNSTASGTAQNSRGVLRLYGTGAYQANIYPQALTAVRNITLPDASGTIALDTVSSSTITNNTTYVLSGTSYLEKQAKVCVADIVMRLSAFPAANTAYTVGTIPDGYRPKRLTPFIAHSINSALTFLGQVETNGNVTLASMGEVNPTGWVNASVTWILA